MPEPQAGSQRRHNNRTTKQCLHLPGIQNPCLLLPDIYHDSQNPLAIIYRLRTLCFIVLIVLYFHVSCCKWQLHNKHHLMFSSPILPSVPSSSPMATPPSSLSMPSEPSIRTVMAPSTSGSSSVHCPSPPGAALSRSSTGPSTCTT